MLLATMISLAAPLFQVATKTTWYTQFFMTLFQTGSNFTFNAVSTGMV